MGQSALDCLVHPADLVIHGANRVCHLGTLGPTLRWCSFGLVVVCGLGCLVGVLRPHLARRALTFVVGVALLATLPGLGIIASLRADSLPHVKATADLVRRRMHAFGTAAQGLACVDVARADCVACQPLAQLVYRACDPLPLQAGGGEPGRGQAVFMPDAFSDTPCRRNNSNVICGGPR